MRISRMLSCAALAGVLAVAAVPAPADAQIGKLLKKAVKEKAARTVVDKAASAAGVPADAASPAEGARRAPNEPAGPGPRFSEYMLEMTPELLDRFEKGLAAERAVQQEIDRLIGKVLPEEEYERCTQAVMSSPEGQRVYREATDLMTGDTSQAHLQRASEEMARRFDRVIEPKCGLTAQKAGAIRDQHAERLQAAAPQGSGLTRLQFDLMKERIVPLCTAIDATRLVAGEARIPTTAQEIYWVYTPVEVEALRPRCAAFTAAFRRGA